MTDAIKLWAVDEDNAAEPLSAVDQVGTLDGSSRRRLRRVGDGRFVAINTSASGVQREEPAVAAGRVEHVLVRIPNGPSDQRRRRLGWCVVGPSGLPVGYLMLDRHHRGDTRAMAPRASREYTVASRSGTPNRGSAGGLLVDAHSALPSVPSTVVSIEIDMDIEEAPAG